MWDRIYIHDRKYNVGLDKHQQKKFISYVKCLFTKVIIF